MTSGVYKFTNLVTGTVYIGSSIDIDRRKYEHGKKPTKREINSKLLYKALVKYGPDAFDFEILHHVDLSEFTSRIELVEYLRQKEQIYLNQYYAQEYIKSGKKDKRFRTLTYNISPIASVPYNKGRKLTEEQLSKRKTWWENNPMSEIERKRRGEKAMGNKSRTGQFNSPESIAKRAATEFKSGKRKVILAQKEDLKILCFGIKECANKLKCSEMNVRKQLSANKLCKGYSLKVLDIMRNGGEIEFL